MILRGPIRAETERYDIIRVSKVTTKSLASGEGSWESNELDESPGVGYSWEFVLGVPPSSSNADPISDQKI